MIQDKPYSEMYPVLCAVDDGYPAGLLDLPPPSPFLHVMGNLQAVNRRLFGIVGTRRATATGKQAASELARMAMLNTGGIVTMLDWGISLTAATLCAASDRAVVAVVPCGLGKIPKTYDGLVAAILRSGGAVVSTCDDEAPRALGREIDAWGTIAALASSMAVVEAMPQSACIEAVNEAARIGRRCYSIAGISTSNVAGTVVVGSASGIAAEEGWHVA